MALRANPPSMQRHLLGCPHTGVWLRVDQAGEWAPAYFDQDGLDASQRATFQRQFLDNAACRDDPLLPAIMPRLTPGVVVTYRREEVIPDGDWYRSAYAMEFRRAVGFDHTVASVIQFRPGAVFGVGGWNEWGGAVFGERQRTLLHLVVAQLGWVLGPSMRVLSAGPVNGKLSPREQQTLSMLLEGAVEKQIAARMGISPHTAHEYVTSLLRKFGVSGRAELMARFVDRRGLP
jgi:DNA-binding CsgD family transcriptional regulator